MVQLSVGGFRTAASFADKAEALFSMGAMQLRSIARSGWGVALATAVAQRAAVLLLLGRPWHLNKRDT